MSQEIGRSTKFTLQAFNEPPRHLPAGLRSSAPQRPDLFRPTRYGASIVCTPTTVVGFNGALCLWRSSSSTMIMKYSGIGQKHSCETCLRRSKGHLNILAGKRRSCTHVCTELADPLEH